MQSIMDEEMSRNAALKVTLQKLKAPAAVAETGQTETQKKAATALKIIDMSEEELNLKQAIDTEELQVQQLQATIKEKNQALKKVQTDIDKERSSGKSVWETVGISTVSYRDPFHTGLSKRTPTGALATLLQLQRLPRILITHLRAARPYAQRHSRTFLSRRSLDGRRWLLHVMIIRS